MEKLIIAGREFSSRLFLGTGKFNNNTLMAEAIKASESEMVTVAMKRIELEDKQDDLLTHITQNPNIQLLPNTSGVRNAEEAVFAAQMAREAGIEGFCYYHYWFGEGRQLLERPFDEVLESGKPDFPFCLCWANHNWTNKSWKKSKTMATGNMIMEMKYSMDDHIKHFYHLFFEDFYLQNL